MNIDLESCSQLLESKNTLVINLLIDHILAQSSMLDKNDQILKSILEKKILEQPTMKKVALWALDKNRIDYIKMILDSPNMDPCFDDYYLIYQAINKGYSEIAIILLNDSRVIAQQHMIPHVLDRAVSNNLTDVVTLLLKNPLIYPTENIYHKAYYGNRFDMLKLLIFKKVI